MGFANLDAFRTRSFQFYLSTSRGESGEFPHHLRDEASRSLRCEPEVRAAVHLQQPHLAVSINHKIVPEKLERMPAIGNRVLHRDAALVDQLLHLQG